MSYFFGETIDGQTITEYDDDMNAICPVCGGCAGCCAVQGHDGNRPAAVLPIVTYSEGIEPLDS